MSARPTVLSVGRARSAWPRTVARWATAGLLPIDHHPCVSPDELADRLADASNADVVLLDGGLPTLGRELIRRSGDEGRAVLIVDDEDRDWVEIGATAVIRPPDDPEELRRLLEQHQPEKRPGPAAPPTPTQAPPGPLVVITGHGGAGTSTVAHGLAARWSGGEPDADVVLADLSLRADQHVHHDIADPGPGVLDLVTAHERSTPSPDSVRGLTRATLDSHHLLTGVRHRRDWTALAPDSVRSALESLRVAFDVVVADVDDDTDGRAETGASDIEERNILARRSTLDATAVVVVFRGDLLGIHRLCRHLETLDQLGLPSHRIHVVANGPRRRVPPARVLHREVAALLDRPFSERSIVAVPHLPGLEARRREGRPPGPRLRRSLTALDHLLAADLDGAEAHGPNP